MPTDYFWDNFFQSFCLFLDRASVFDYWTFELCERNNGSHSTCVPTPEACWEVCLSGYGFGRGGHMEGSEMRDYHGLFHLAQGNHRDPYKHKVAMLKLEKPWWWKQKLEKCTLEEGAKSQGMKVAFRSWKRRLERCLCWSSICKCEYLGVDCQYLYKNLHMAVRAYNPSMEEVEKGRLLGLGDQPV